MGAKVSLSLEGVPETMLWTLHNRATEALRSDGVLDDPAAIRVFEQIDFDFKRIFGRPEGSHGLRSRLYDDALKPWIQAHPGGQVIELACGLETQFERCDDGRVHWLMVDWPKVLTIREELLPANPRCRMFGGDILELDWMTGVDPSQPIFITAQGLLMYLQPDQVVRLLTSIFERFPRLTLAFDVVPQWFSRLTHRGYRPTRFYRSPPMPWGINRSGIVPFLQGTTSRPLDVEILSYGPIRGLVGSSAKLISRWSVCDEYLAHLVVARVKS